MKVEQREEPIEKPNPAPVQQTATNQAAQTLAEANALIETMKLQLKQARALLLDAHERTRAAEERYWSLKQTFHSCVCVCVCVCVNLRAKRGYWCEFLGHIWFSFNKPQ